MKNSLVLGEDWHVLLKMFPPTWKALAKSTEAVTRKLRTFKNEESIMRVLLMHIAGGHSLRETATRAKLAKIANVTDVALLKRLKCSENWFKELCIQLLQERGLATVRPDGKIRMRLVDGTNVKEPGKTGSLWRIHYSLTLPDLQCDYFKLTDTKGSKTGESFKQFPVKKGDCIVGDRGYSTAQGISYVASQGAYCLVRVNSASLPLLTHNGEQFKLLEELRSLEKEYDSKEWSVSINADGQVISGRLCVIRKSFVAEEEALKSLRRRASKRQRKVKETTEELCKYVILFTTLPPRTHPLNTVLEWYRLRWQIELNFKRLKPLAGLGHLPKHDEESSRAWLYGKLFTGLLVEKLIHYAKTISPWGYL